MAIHLSGLPGDCSSRSGRAAHVPRLALLRVGFAEPAGSPRPLVRSCRTVSPLPVRANPSSAVFFLWHFPAGHPDWLLASTLPCGAPTFLDPVPQAVRTAATRPAHRHPPVCQAGRRCSCSDPICSAPVTDPESKTFADALSTGEFVVTAELGPPTNPDPEPVRRTARAFVGSVHAANVTDNQVATVKLSPLACAVWMMEEGLAPILQLTTRDRNVMALQSDLLGAWALGVRSVMALSGDPLNVGPYEGKTILAATIARFAIPPAIWRRENSSQVPPASAS